MRYPWPGTGFNGEHVQCQPWHLNASHPSDEQSVSLLYSTVLVNCTLHANTWHDEGFGMVCNRAGPAVLGLELHCQHAPGLWRTVRTAERALALHRAGHLVVPSAVPSCPLDHERRAAAHPAQPPAGHRAPAERWKSVGVSRAGGGDNAWLPQMRLRSCVVQRSVLACRVARHTCTRVNGHASCHEKTRRDVLHPAYRATR